jgi:hypothetical protein
MQSKWRGWASLWACGLLILAGCSGGLKKTSVSGKVTINGQPLTSGRVLFFPDEEKGNEARVGCVGRLDGEGHYELRTSAMKGSDSGPGAPPGWYKVIVQDLQGKNEVEQKVHPKYLNEKTTPLSIEVVADPPPGHYDIDLKP